MQEIKCPNCGEVFQVNESSYDQIAKQVRDKEFSKELEQRREELAAKHENELEIIRLQKEKEYSERIKQKDNEISEKNQKLSELRNKLKTISALPITRQTTLVSKSSRKTLQPSRLCSTVLIKASNLP